MIDKAKLLLKFIGLIIFYHAILVAATSLLENQISISTTTWLALKHFYMVFALFFAFFGWAKGFSYIASAVHQINQVIPWKKLNFSRQRINRSLTEVDVLGDNGKHFESYVAALYRSLGFKSQTTTELKEEKNMPAEVLKNSGQGEQGVDVIVFLPEMMCHENGTEYDALLIQCKQYSNSVSNDAIQEIYGAIPMYSRHFKRKFLPMVITNNYYTPSAKDLANSNRVILLDREGLGELINKASRNLSDAKKY